MGANVQSSGGADRRARRGRRRGKHRRVMAEINITPFVDVMLVLLIIFMVAAPLSVVGVPVELSRTAAKALEAPEEEPLSVTINADGQVFLQTTEVSRDDLIPRLRAIAAERVDDKVFLRIDGQVAWDSTAQIMGALNAAGFSRIGFVTEGGGPTLTGQGN
ncbi:Cell division and transport-associated protein TolR (TC 2.C.1.2.1) [Aliiroseovarius halocynthiae]|uniref:ExbD/TolR family protein n=1 Tax=Aliiroseovarius halocynthiae TaxID=985055 RepID=A0A545SV16_9RHOB|nr:ExbD/TolR family protein [Aliiroseovarius halocynthiae]TQV68801.1 ExbD/TolR family protein [Aliiroseovarius halocynthiae]SMR71227.1 Cell division and transport-associated protein TolR (TC 2.C.1.2.1) [Aliiroseovarius halocynthiae]